MSKDQIVIVGAGMVGLASAIRLLQKGYDVTLVDRAHENAASFNNACVLSMSSIIPLTSPNLPKQLPKYLFHKDSPLSIRKDRLFETAGWLLKFLLAGRMDQYLRTADALTTLFQDVLGEHRNLAELASVNDCLVSKPLLFLYVNKDSYEKDSLSWRTRKNRGVDSETWSFDQIRKEEPELTDFYKWAVECPNHGYVSDIYAYLKGLRDYVFQLGGKWVDDEVQHIRTEKNNLVLKLGKGRLNTDKLLIAAGSRSGKLARMIGEKIPITAEGGYWIDVQEPGIHVSHAMINTHLKMAVTPLRGGGVRFAGFADIGGVDAKPDYRHCERLKQYAKFIFPNITINSYTKGYGQRPSITDSLPVIGPSAKNPRIFYACGHQHVGISTGPITAKIISALIAGETPGVDPAPFSITRF